MSTDVNRDFATTLSYMVSEVVCNDDKQFDIHAFRISWRRMFTNMRYRVSETKDLNFIHKKLKAVSFYFYRQSQKMRGKLKLRKFLNPKPHLRRGDVNPRLNPPRRRPPPPRRRPPPPRRRPPPPRRQPPPPRRQPPPPRRRPLPPRGSHPPRQRRSQRSGSLRRTILNPQPRKGYCPRKRSALGKVI